MLYIRTSLADESSRLISKLTVSDESVATAWELHTARYENKRFLVSAHLDRLLCSSAMAAHTAAEQNQLTATTSKALSALRVLGSPTEHWDSVVVHALVRRLSSKFRRPSTLLVSDHHVLRPSQPDRWLQGRSGELDMVCEWVPAAYNPGSHNPREIHNKTAGGEGPCRAELSSDVAKRGRFGASHREMNLKPRKIAEQYIGCTGRVSEFRESVARTRAPLVSTLNRCARRLLPGSRKS